MADQCLSILAEKERSELDGWISVQQNNIDRRDVNIARFFLGFWKSQAVLFGAAMYQLEHRFYGSSRPTP